MFTKNPPTMDVLMCYDYDPNENINCYYETEFLYMYSILGLNLVKMIGQNFFVDSLIIFPLNEFFGKFCFLLEKCTF